MARVIRMLELSGRPERAPSTRVWLSPARGASLGRGISLRMCVAVLDGPGSDPVPCLTVSDSNGPLRMFSARAGDIHLGRLTGLHVRPKAEELVNGVPERLLVEFIAVNALAPALSGRRGLLETIA